MSNITKVRMATLFATVIFNEQYVVIQPCQIQQNIISVPK